MKRPWFLVAALSLASLFFGWRTYLAWTAPVAGDHPPSSAAAVVPIGIPPEPQAAELPTSAAPIIARPVFRPDRRAFKEDAVSAPARMYGQELSRFSLLGILLLGDTRQAIVTGKTAGGTERFEVSPGESLPGFEVKEIRQDGILLVADGKDFLLPLNTGSPSVQAAAGIRTALPPPQTAPAPSSGGAIRPPAASVRADAGTSPVRQETAAGVSPREQLPAAAVSGPSGGPVQARQMPYRGKVRPTYTPGMR